MPSLWGDDGCSGGPTKDCNLYIAKPISDAAVELLFNGKHPPLALIAKTASLHLLDAFCRDKDHDPPQAAGNDITVEQATERQGQASNAGMSKGCVSPN